MRKLPEAPIELIDLYPKQKQFIRSNKTFVAYGGARGGGKSRAVQELVKIYAKLYPGIQILLVRRTYKDVMNNHVIPLKVQLHCVVEGDPKAACRFSNDEQSFIFANGSRIKFGYCDNENDVMRYQGLAYDLVVLEEATHFTEFQFECFTEIVRPSGLCQVKFKPRMRLTCNPGGVGHFFIKRLFLDRKFKDTENPDDYEFIPAKVYDNKFIMENDPAYVKRLENLPPERRKMMLEGSFDVFTGLFFYEFDKDYHVLYGARLPQDRNYNLYIALDYGLDMFAAEFVCVTPEKVFVFDEICEERVIISDAAMKIKAKIENLGFEYEDFTAILAPDDMWNTSQVNGRCKADLWSDYGVNLTKVKRDRQAGWLAIKEALKVDYSLPKEERADTAELHIWSKCTNLIECLPKLQTSDKSSDDCATEPHEFTHSPDALRCFYTYWISKPDIISGLKHIDLPQSLYDDYMKCSEEVREYLENKYGDIRVKENL